MPEQDASTTDAEQRVRDRSGRPGVASVGPGGNLDLENVFSYHAPFGDQVERYGDIRDAGWDLARMIEQHCPASPERSTAFAKIREVVFWANASIACNERKPDDQAQ